MNPFAEKMASLSDQRLLEVLERRNDYQPLAVEAAEEELQRRNLAPRAIEQLQQERAQQQQELENKTFALRLLAGWAESFFGWLGKGLNFFRVGDPQTALYPVMVYTALFVFADLYFNWRWVRVAVQLDYPLQLFTVLALPLVQLFALVMLLVKQRNGWYLLLDGLCLSFFGSLARWLLLEVIIFDSWPLHFEYGFWEFHGPTYTLFMLPPPLLIALLLFHKNVRAVLGINRPFRGLMLGLGSGFVFMLLCLGIARYLDGGGRFGQPDANIQSVTRERVNENTPPPEQKRENPFKTRAPLQSSPLKTDTFPKRK